MALPEAATTITSPAPEVQASATPAAQVATPALAAGDDPSALKAQLESLLKWKAEAEGDLKKGRDARRLTEEKAAADKVEAEEKIRAAGDFAKLHEIEREKRTALEAQLADLAPKAERLSAHEKRVISKLDAATAKGDLPAHVVRSIVSIAARDPDEALEILEQYRDEHRASLSQASPGKQPANPAPVAGGPAGSPPVRKSVDAMTPAEIQNLKSTDPAAFAALFGGAPNGKPAFSLGKWLGG